MPSQIDLDDKYLAMASIWSELSKARRMKVGCLIVRDCMIISDGYNGTPSGFDNNCEYETSAAHLLDKDKESPAIKLINNGKTQITTKPEVLHAETNAISKLAKSTQSSIGATIYITIPPCIHCSKLIIQTGITRVVWKDEYLYNDGIQLLKRAGIKISGPDVDWIKMQPGR